jgi:hypothetical protein
MAMPSVHKNPFISKEKIHEEHQSNSVGSCYSTRSHRSGKGSERIVLRLCRLLRFLFRMLEVT